MENTPDYVLCYRVRLVALSLFFPRARQARLNIVGRGLFWDLLLLAFLVTYSANLSVVCVSARPTLLSDRARLEQYFSE
jgi:hypothetical protein